MCPGSGKIAISFEFRSISDKLLPINNEKVVDIFHLGCWTVSGYEE